MPCSNNIKQQYCFIGAFLSVILGGWVLEQELSDVLPTEVTEVSAFVIRSELRLERFLALTTLIDMLWNLETLWLRSTLSLRTLPFWAATPHGFVCSSWNPILLWSRFLFRYPILNDTMVAIVIVSLLAIGILGSACGEYLQLLRIVVACCFALLSLADIPRIIRLSQMMLNCSSFAFGSPLFPVLIMLGSTYWWSGLSKTILSRFYTEGTENTHWIFSKVLDRLAPHLGLSTKFQRKIYYVIVGLSMSSEAIVGLTLLDCCTLRLASPLFHSIVGGWGSVFMHAYIVIFIVFRLWEPGILNWNIACMMASLIATRMAQAAGVNALPDLASPYVVAFNLFVFLFYCVYPASMYFGYCFVYEFSLSYFNPVLFGYTWAVFPLHVRKHFPHSANRETLRIYQGDIAAGEQWEWRNLEPMLTYRQQLLAWRDGRDVSLALLVKQMRPLIGTSADEVACPTLPKNLHSQYPKENESDTEALEWLLKHTFAIDCDWLCSTHASCHTDQYQYQANCTMPKHFFEFLGREVFGTAGVYIRTEHAIHLSGTHATQEVLRYLE